MICIVTFIYDYLLFYINYLLIRFNINFNLFFLDVVNPFFFLVKMSLNVSVHVGRITTADCLP